MFSSTFKFCALFALFSSTLALPGGIGDMIGGGGLGAILGQSGDLEALVGIEDEDREQVIGENHHVNVQPMKHPGLKDNFRTGELSLQDNIDDLDNALIQLLSTLDTLATFSNQGDVFQQIREENPSKLSTIETNLRQVLRKMQGFSNSPAPPTTAPSIIN